MSASFWTEWDKKEGHDVNLGKTHESGKEVEEKRDQPSYEGKRCGGGDENRPKERRELGKNRCGNRSQLANSVTAKTAAAENPSHDLDDSLDLIRGHADRALECGRDLVNNLVELDVAETGVSRGQVREVRWRGRW